MKIILFLFLALGFSLNTFAGDPPGNFGTFGEGLYRGARLEKSHFAYLKSLGVKTIINLQGGDIKDPVLGPVAGWLEPGESDEWITLERQSAEGLGIRFIHVPLSSITPANRQLGYDVGRVLKMLNDPANQPVYVHCEHGEDRTGVVVALYRVFYENWDPQAAYDEMVQMGHGFLNQVITSPLDDFYWAVIADHENNP